MRIDRRLAAALTAIGLALVVVGSFLPWFRSGRRARSSYELFDLVDRLDLLSDGMARVADRGLAPRAAGRRRRGGRSAARSERLLVP